MSNISKEEVRQNVISYPHILDWFFTVRTEAFVRYWLYNTLGAEWHWYRFEFSVLRGAIHCHGLAKLKSNPNLCELNSKAVDGYFAQQKIQEGNLTNSELPLLQDTIDQGKLAEQRICQYYDFLVNCTNPGENNQWETPTVHPCLKTYDEFFTVLR